MSGEALTRYIVGDKHSLVHLGHYLCNRTGYEVEVVLADDADREIERLEEDKAWLVEDRKRVYESLEQRMAERDTLEAQVRELEQAFKSAEEQVKLTSKYVGLVGNFFSIGQSEFMQRSIHTQLEQERDRLREQYNKVLGAIDEGLVEDDATLAAASVTEMHATISSLRGLIGALPKLEPFQVAGLCSDLQRYWGKQTTDPLAALLRERQT